MSETSRYQSLLKDIDDAKSEAGVDDESIFWKPDITLTPEYSTNHAVIAFWRSASSGKRYLSNFLSDYLAKAIQNRLADLTWYAIELMYQDLAEQRAKAMGEIAELGLFVVPQEPLVDYKLASTSNMTPSPEGWVLSIAGDITASIITKN